MNQKDILNLAALLHDLGKFRQRATERFKPHQEHSFEFVSEDFAGFFAECGDEFKNSILNHHGDGENLLEKQVILADRLSASEHKTEGTAQEDFTDSALVSVLSRLKCAEKDRHYKLTALNFDQVTVIPEDSVTVNHEAYKNLWEEFKASLQKVIKGKPYTPAHYQSIVALLRKYTSRIPSGQNEDNPDSDISLYDHLRTTAAIAACIEQEFCEQEVDNQLSKEKDMQKDLCSLIKGDISGIQNFLYHVQSDGASNQLRGRSFYLQLLTEAIAQWVLRQFDLPVTNLLLCSGGHFYILAPYTNAKQKLDEIRKTISDNLWKLHRGDISCIVTGVPVNVADFEENNFNDKWREVSEKVQKLKQKKWSEMGSDSMFHSLFTPEESRWVDETEEEKNDPWKFGILGQDSRYADYLFTFQIPPKLDVPEKPIWRDTIKAFGMNIDFCPEKQNAPKVPDATEHVCVYTLGNTDFLEGTEKYHWGDVPTSYDFRTFRSVTAQENSEKTADYDYLAEASDGVKWLGALRMDVDNLGAVFTEKLDNATISRLGTLSEAMRLFFEGYVPQLCRDYNNKQRKNKKGEILELIYAGGDDLFLVGGWSALPDIAEQIRTEFRQFVTGDHVTLSGGIAIEHKKFPLYQFAARSGDAETAAKGIDDKKNAITFLQQPMKWEDFAKTREWHKKFMDVLTGQDQLPRDILMRLRQIYSEKELKEYRWAWRSIYYFHRMQERYKYDEQKAFLNKLKQKLNHEESSQFREELIHVITRWTALRIRQ